MEESLSNMCTRRLRFNIYTEWGNYYWINRCRRHMVMTGAVLAKQQLLVFTFSKFVTRVKNHRAYYCFEVNMRALTFPSGTTFLSQFSFSFFQIYEGNTVYNFPHELVASKNIIVSHAKTTDQLVEISPISRTTRSLRPSWTR